MEKNYDGWMDGTWESCDRRIQKSARRTGLDDRRRTTLLASFQKGGDCKRTSTRVENRLRSALTNADSSRDLSRPSEWRATMKIFKNLFERYFCRREKEQLAALQQERDAQEERLKELTRATLDGENEWFLNVVRKDPECALKIVHDCLKEEGKR